MMSVKLVLAVAALVASTHAHTWTVQPESRTYDPAASNQNQTWEPNKGPCSRYQNQHSSDPATYNALVPRIVDFAKAGDEMEIEWYNEHDGAWPNCNDQAQYMYYSLLENPTAPDQSTAKPVGSECGSRLKFTAAIPEDVNTGTYTLQMKWRYDAQSGAAGGSPPTFYSCSDIDVSGRDDNQNLDSSNTITGRVLSVLPFLAPLGIIPAMIACALARQHKRESVRLTRMTQMSGTGSMYADVAAGRGAGAGSGGDRTTMMSGVSVLSGDSVTSGMSANRATGVSSLTQTNGGYSRSSNGSRASRGSRGSKGRHSRGSRGSGGKRSSGGSRGSRGR